MPNWLLRSVKPDKGVARAVEEIRTHITLSGLRPRGLAAFHCGANDPDDQRGKSLHDHKALTTASSLSSDSPEHSCARARCLQCRLEGYPPRKNFYMQPVVSIAAHTAGRSQFIRLRAGSFLCIFPIREVNSECLPRSGKPAIQLLARKSALAIAQQRLAKVNCLDNR